MTQPASELLCRSMHQRTRQTNMVRSLGDIWSSWLSKPAFPVREAKGYQPEEAEYSGVPEKGNGTEESFS